MDELRVKILGAPRGLFVLVGAVVLSLVLVTVSFVRGGAEAAELREVHEANEATIHDLRTELSRFEGSTDPGDSSASPTSGRSPLAAGSAVASRQNSYYDARLDPDPAAKADVARRSLEAHLEAGSEDAAGEWFTCADTRSRFTWDFRSRYVCVGDEMECLWICTDRSDLVVAFAVGTYHAESDKFSDVHVYATRYGSETYQGVGGQATVYVDDDPVDVTTDPVGTNPQTPSGFEPGGTDATNPGESGNPGGSSSSGGDDDESTWASQMEELLKKEQESGS